MSPDISMGVMYIYVCIHTLATPQMGTASAYTVMTETQNKVSTSIRTIWPPVGPTDYGEMSSTG